MTISLILLAGALPAVRHELQREREEELFWRGQQIAIAIARYAQDHGGQPPLKLEDLAERFDLNGRPKRYLRPSALRDPMTPKGDWRPIHPGDPLVGELHFAYLTATQRPLPLPPALARFAMPQSSIVQGPGADQGQTTAGAFRSSLQSETGPIIGVVSRSQESLIRNYYGIDTYDRSLFICCVPVPGQVPMFVMIAPPGQQGAPGQQRPPGQRPPPPPRK
jgi:hypothetical protein